MSEELMVCHGAEVATVPVDRPFVIGRGSAADLRLADARVSRRHLMVRQTEHGWSVLDISANGTWLDGERVRRVDVCREVRLNLGAVNGPRITLIPGPPPSFPDYPLPVVPELLTVPTEITFSSPAIDLGQTRLLHDVAFRVPSQASWPARATT
ncbi:FHA domain-containing protein [Frankia sp. AgB1.9]|uniref:FHA domain-containing protein n=1 Tax=unclassified Frankia TaxID=2632575 RepID=UPI00193272E6|nr:MULTISPECIES: FHA domain-containing protein [unclassified Frankia]MBL7487721.1 FHA domain-containing protein [Frankia sp. AgW1.1]MBL7548036.1 FHA domain-containing protein [Frankia sp. AgB1.9]MBL7624112.1 FHA domain-containing protein [Frankia sp. AgB1.8]